MSEPTDQVLYNKIKRKVYKDIPKHSAYRSGIVVRKYKIAFQQKHPKKEPYRGTYTRKKGLKRWFDEKWVNQRGEVGYSHKHDIYRPSKRITKKTPTTHGELTEQELKRARQEKYRKGRVKRFKSETIRGGRKTHKKKHKRSKGDFTPNLSPREIFQLGSFGGTYWRPIYSSVVKKHLKNVHKQYPKSWWKDIPENYLSRPDYDKSINKYNVEVGTSLEFWESKRWINKENPYGWVHWYCDYYQGKRGPDDVRQIKRWQALAGPNGRFMRFLVTQILKHSNYEKRWNDETISPKIRQVLQHWGYVLTKADFDREVKRRQ